MDEWTAHHRDFYLTTHTSDKYPCPWWDWNHNQSSQVAVDLYVTLRSHWDRQLRYSGVTNVYAYHNLQQFSVRSCDYVYWWCRRTALLIPYDLNCCHPFMQLDVYIICWVPYSAWWYTHSTAYLDGSNLDHMQSKLLFVYSTFKHKCN
jgi:hypothetical protein